MPLFNASTKTRGDVLAEIADTVGASADSDMLTRAGRSLDAAVEYFNTRANWDFLLVDANPIVVVAPFTVTGITGVSGQTSALAPASHGFAVDDFLTGNGVVLGTRVSATAASSIGLNQAIGAGIGTAVNATADWVATRDFYTLPSDYKASYSVRLYVSQNTIRQIRRRFYDRSIVNEFAVSTPLYYDVYYIAGKGKIRLLPPPVAADVMQIRYYRRMAVTTGVQLLDVPQDYEFPLISFAKWHFLTDKADGRSDQAQTWLGLATDGIKQMLADQTRAPDEDLGFQPGAYTYNPAAGPNSVRRMDWETMGG